MRLHLKLGLSFAVILFVLFGLVAILSMSLVAQKFDEESRRRTIATLEFLHEEYERLRQETAEDVAEVARDPAAMPPARCIPSRDRCAWSCQAP